jgi:pimeloyl-ACP methyl ester carboxylesterase
MLTFVNAMIPLPGETAGDWWDNTGATEARREAARKTGYGTEFDETTYFLHDVPEDVARDSASHAGDEARVIFKQPCRFDGWPEVPIHVLVGADDRFFPLDFQKRLAAARLNRGIDTVLGGHLVALSNPEALASRLLAHADELIRA